MKLNVAVHQTDWLRITDCLRKDSVSLIFLVLTLKLQMSFVGGG
jgi:hypothetical protein